MKKLKNFHVIIRYDCIGFKSKKDVLKSFDHYGLPSYSDLKIKQLKIYEILQPKETKAK